MIAGVATVLTAGALSVAAIALETAVVATGVGWYMRLKNISQ